MSDSIVCSSLSNTCLFTFHNALRLKRRNRTSWDVNPPKIGILIDTAVIHCQENGSQIDHIFQLCKLCLKYNILLIKKTLKYHLLKYGNYVLSEVHGQGFLSMLVKSSHVIRRLLSTLIHLQHCLLKWTHLSPVLCWTNILYHKQKTKYLIVSFRCWHNMTTHWWQPIYRHVENWITHRVIFILR